MAYFIYNYVGSNTQLSSLALSWWLWCWTVYTSKT